MLASQQTPTVCYTLLQFVVCVGLVERVLQGEGDIGKVVCSWALCLMHGDGSSAPSDSVFGNVGV